MNEKEKTDDWSDFPPESTLIRLIQIGQKEKFHLLLFLSPSKVDSIEVTFTNTKFKLSHTHPLSLSLSNAHFITRASPLR